MHAARGNKEDVVLVRQHFLIIGDVRNLSGDIDIHFKETMAVQFFGEHAGAVIRSSMGEDEVFADIVVLPAGIVAVLLQPRTNLRFW